MKVRACPEDLPAPEFDPSEEYDAAKEGAIQAEHKAKLKERLITMGYTGEYTGEILNIPRGDGYAMYMMADGQRSYLVHLPYGDAWDSPDVDFLPKREVIRRIEAQRSLRAVFAG